MKLKLTPEQLERRVYYLNKHRQKSYEASRQAIKQITIERKKKQLEEYSGEAFVKREDLDELREIDDDLILGCQDEIETLKGEVEKLKVKLHKQDKIINKLVE